MSDWLDACDPVPPRRELTEAEKRRRARIWKKEKTSQWMKNGTEAPSSYAIEPDFDEMGA